MEFKHVGEQKLIVIGRILAEKSNPVGSTDFLSVIEPTPFLNQNPAVNFSISRKGSKNFFTPEIHVNNV